MVILMAKAQAVRTRCSTVHEIRPDVEVRFLNAPCLAYQSPMSARALGDARGVMDSEFVVQISESRRELSKTPPTPHSMRRGPIIHLATRITRPVRWTKTACIACQQACLLRAEPAASSSFSPALPTRRRRNQAGLAPHPTRAPTRMCRHHCWTDSDRTVRRPGARCRVHLLTELR